METLGMDRKFGAHHEPRTGAGRSREVCENLTAGQGPCLPDLGTTLEAGQIGILRFGF